MGFAAILMVAPGLTTDLYALVLALPVLVQQVAGKKKLDLIAENA
jgi:UPF0716 family protein affecting phage T7 exclusion